MISTISGLVFLISFIGFIVLLVLGLIKTRKVNKKTWIWLLVAIVSMFIGAATVEIPEKTTNQTKTENQSKESSSTSSSSSISSSSSAKQPIDNNVVESLKNDLKSGNIVEFLKTYYSQDKQKSLEYYQKAEVATTKTTIKGQVIERNTSGTRLYIYVPVEDMPANVRQTKQNAYVVAVKDDNGRLKNFTVGQPAEVTGYLVGRGDKELGYNWDMKVAN